MEMEMDSIVESYTDSDVEQVGHDVSSHLSYFSLEGMNRRIKDALQSSNNLFANEKLKRFQHVNPRSIDKAASAIFKLHPCECEGDKNSCETCKTLMDAL